MKNIIAILKKPVFILLVLLSYACSQEDLDETKSKVVEDISVNSVYGFLEFKDLKVFDEAKKSLETMRIEEIDNWESEFSGFNSLRSIYEMALAEEEKYFEDISESGNNLETQNNLHSDFVKERLDIFTLNDGKLN